MKLVKILSDKVQIRSDYKEFDDVRINDLIAVSDGEVELVTMVNTLTDIDTENEEEIGENDYILEHSSTKMLECSIIGTVKDGTFQKAIDKYPTMKVSAHRISKEEFASMDILRRSTPKKRLKSSLMNGFTERKVKNNGRWNI